MCVCVCVDVILSQSEKRCTVVCAFKPSLSAPGCAHIVGKWDQRTCVCAHASHGCHLGVITDFLESQRCLSRCDPPSGRNGQSSCHSHVHHPRRCHGSHATNDAHAARRRGSDLGALVSALRKHWRMGISIECSWDPWMQATQTPWRCRWARPSALKSFMPL